MSDTDVEFIGGDCPIKVFWMYDTTEDFAVYGYHLCKAYPKIASEISSIRVQDCMFRIAGGMLCY